MAPEPAHKGLLFWFGWLLSIVVRGGLQHSYRRACARYPRFVCTEIHLRQVCGVSEALSYSYAPLEILAPFAVRSSPLLLVPGASPGGLGRTTYVGYPEAKDPGAQAGGRAGADATAEHLDRATHQR